MSLFFSFYIKASEIKVAIVDTGFCNNHKEVTYFDATFEVPMLNCPKDYLKLPRFHGENVLNVFQKNIDAKNKINLTLITVFDKTGKQNMSSWQSAIKYIKDQKIDFVISAVGMPVLQNKKVNLSGIWLMSAPRIEPGIKKADIIFPQNQYSAQNVFLVGTYFKNKMRDTGLLYDKNISLYLEDNDDIDNTDFKGSSRAVSIIGSKLISICSTQNLKAFRACLNRNKKLVFDDIYSL